jgi:serine protease Do
MSGPTVPRTGRKPALVAALLASTILISVGAGWAASGAEPPPLSLPLVTNPAGFSGLVTKVKPAIVNIAVTEVPQNVSDAELPSLPSGMPFGEQQKAEPTHGLASGFIIDPAGYIVTNNHVIDHTRKIMVTLDDGQTYPAKVVGHDAKTDLALIKIDAGKDLPYVAFGNSDKTSVGDWVVAVGNPFGLGGTVTAGIISAHGRNLNGPYDDYLQIDAPINPGNSGGPLFDQSGQVIGIDTAIYSPSGGSVGIGFAVPSNIASQVVAQLREHGRVERGWLGVRMQALTPTLAKAVGRPNTEGVIVDAVQADSPAAHAKLQQGDIITAFNGTTVTSPRELALAVANTKEGSDAKLSIWRHGEEQAVQITIGQQPSTEQAAAQQEKSSEPRVGLALEKLTPDLRDQLGLTASVSGVYVADVTAGSPAEESGMRSGDVIVRVSNEAVTTPSQAAAAIHGAEQEKKPAVPLLVMRDGNTYYVALQLAA